MAAAGALALLLVACSMPGGDSPPLPPGVPAGAIRVADDLYMVPLGPDDGGCEQFQPFSQRSAVIQALHYRAADGRFVLDRGQAAC